MQPHHHSFLRRALIVPAVVAGIVAVGATLTGTAEWSPRPEVAAASPADPIVMAELTVDQKVADLTRGRDCYQDPTGREPTEAVVKVDGTTTVRVMPRDDAWTAAHEGTVWVQAWCSAKEQS